MIVTCKDLYEFVDSFNKLPILLEETGMKEQGTFKANWQKVFGSKEAAEVDGIVYLWITERPIPRLCGESRIVYIGQSKGTLQKRHYGCANIEANGASNILKYPYLIEKYGKIEILYRPISDFWGSPKEGEDQLLWWYFQNHLEYPPLNYTKAAKYRSQLKLP